MGVIINRLVEKVTAIMTLVYNVLQVIAHLVKKTNSKKRDSIILNCVAIITIMIAAKFFIALFPQYLIIIAALAVISILVPGLFLLAEIYGY